jgi:soluble lytic murein transglycosylase-like protein
VDLALEAKVRDECRRQGVAFAPVKALIGHESNWDHSARSGTGAEGLMQLTSWPVRQWNQDHPSGRQYALTDRFDIDINIRIGVWYLTYCANQMKVSASSGAAADWALIYGAYNLGPGAMKLLVSGDVSNAAVVKAWAGQSSFLKQGGVKRYIHNAQSLFA